MFITNQHLKYLLFIGITLLCPLSALAQSLSDFFYPFYTFQYTLTPAIKNPLTRMRYEIGKTGNILYVTKTQVMGLQEYEIGQDAYYLSADKTVNGIISNQQVYYNSFTRDITRSYDNIVMFMNPRTNKEYWSETRRGEKYECSAEHVYIVYDGKYSKAIKITRKTKAKNNIVTTWEYWLPNMSRIATFGQWGKGKRSIIEVSDMIRPEADISEISSEEYNSHKK